jgi:hypothetical protein
MVSDETYEICLAVLEDSTLEDEDKTDKLEALLKEKTSLSGQALEHAVLDAMWRYKEGGGTATSPLPIRQTILRRPSPASWRGPGTPLSGSPRLGVSPLAPPGFMPSSFNRTKSSTASPFGSPRPSPRLALASPAAIPHSPSLSAYHFGNDESPSQETFGEIQSDNVDWLVSDDTASIASSLGTGSGLNAAAPEFSSLQSTDMTPYDMLRSILGHSRTDEEIDGQLALHGYDLGAALAAFVDTQASDTPAATSLRPDGNFITVGKSMTPDVRPSTPNDQKSGTICKFYLSTGQCLRADCRFSHDLTTHVCKYWLAGNCLAGSTCVFSHDPSHLVNQLSIGGTNTPPAPKSQAPLAQDFTSFPSLGSGTPENTSPFAAPPRGPAAGVTPPPGFRGMHGFIGERPRSRPVSRGTAAAPLMDDIDAFPSLGAASKTGKKHHGKRGGHGHGHKENIVGPSTLADIVKMSPSPALGARPDRKLGRNGSSTSIRNGENSVAAQAIPSPKHIPWLETGDRANKAYLKARQEAIKHGGLRNKFLQR